MKQALTLTRNEERQVLEKMKNAFIRSVQHELRTPVSIILGYTDFLKNGALGGLDQNQQQAVVAIAGQAGVLRRLVERITTLLDLEAYEAFEQPMTVSDIVISVTETHLGEAIRAGVTLTHHLSPELPLITGNLGYLKQAVECLVENGLKFTPAGGQVRVEADVRDNWIYLTVADSGIGIAPDKLEHIFDAFYQIDGSITRQYDGLGLGLAVARAVIRAHSGEIEVESQVGQGTLFTIQLPAMTNPILTAPPVSADRRLKRILVVDDEEFVTFTLQEGLAKLPNCEVATANSGQQALQIFEQDPFDLLITDYRMPDIDGISLARQIWQKQPHLAIIMITAYGDSILRNQRAEVPVQYILDKPVKLADVRNLTMEMLAERSTSPNRAYIN